MARPNKQGLDYFPFDVDFFSDEKIAAISGEFGIEGEIAAIKLLCAVYRNGYFVEWSEMLQMKLLKELPGVSIEILRQIVARLVRWGFFDKTLFDTSGILTSRGIQKRYFAIAYRRNSVNGNLPYVIGGRNRIIDSGNSSATGLLPAEIQPQNRGPRPDTGVIASNNQVIAINNPAEEEFLLKTTSKVKESKGKKETNYVGKEKLELPDEDFGGKNGLEKSDAGQIDTACVSEKKSGGGAADFSASIRRLTFEENVRECMDSPRWQQDALISAGFSGQERAVFSQEDWKRYFGLFRVNIGAYDYPTSMTLRDFRRHFINWLRIRHNEQLKKQINDIEKKMVGNERAGIRKSLGRPPFPCAPVVPDDRGKSVL